MKLRRDLHLAKECSFGFTLLELLLVMSIAMLLFGIGAVASVDTYKRYILQTEQRVLVGALEKARSRALGNVAQSAHGVCFKAPNYIIFQGVTCVVESDTNEYVPASTFIAELSHFDTSFPTVVFSQLSATTTPVTIEVVGDVGVVPVVINYEGTITH